MIQGVWATFSSFLASHEILSFNMHHTTPVMDLVFPYEHDSLNIFYIDLL